MKKDGEYLVSEAVDFGSAIVEGKGEACELTEKGRECNSKVVWSSGLKIFHDGIGEVLVN